ncbi:hypothetical protein Pyrfu_1497 [Pyrolobus fumarii 1A]|uniref:Thioredoxin-like fold domain-containing protein n=1 Tax=Pyrolobus fumarii (strain DSM 11204 / 1A) TaxID=694429 RepID=G0EHK2_PYRF1|nr:hypothetical protein [Pyrolobus fumarii]AEM39355.1 hypothetical protein Pyrfu_1497 [Pyrolobus fumarii 1A]
MTVGLDVEREITTPTLGVGLLSYDTMDMQLEANEDAVIEVVMALNDESENALEVARRAAERLREEYGVNAVIVPRVEYWGHLPPGYAPYPRIVVNGELVAVGVESLNEDRIIDAVLALLGERSERVPMPQEFAPLGRRHFAAPAEAAAMA